MGRVNQKMRRVWRAAASFVLPKVPWALRKFAPKLTRPCTHAWVRRVRSESSHQRALSRCYGGKISGSQQKVIMLQMQIWQKKNEKNWHVWQFLWRTISSLRSRRLGVVGTRKNGRARRGLTPRVSPSRAPVLSFAHFFQAPATQARWFQSGTKRKPVTLLSSFDNANGHLWVISVKQDCWDPEIWLSLWRDVTLIPSIVRITEVSIHE